MHSCPVGCVRQAHAGVGRPLPSVIGVDLFFLDLPTITERVLSRCRPPRMRRGPPLHRCSVLGHDMQSFSRLYYGRHPHTKTATVFVQRLLAAARRMSATLPLNPAIALYFSPAAVLLCVPSMKVQTRGIAREELCGHTPGGELSDGTSSRGIRASKCHDGVRSIC